MKITLSNDKEFKCKSVTETRRFTGGADRNALILVFNTADYKSDELYSEFGKKENTGKIIVSEEVEVPSEDREEPKTTTVEHTYTGYSLLDTLKINGDGETKIYMAQKTYTEEQIDIQGESIDSINEVMADIIGGVY